MLPEGKMLGVVMRMGLGTYKNVHVDDLWNKMVLKKYGGLV